MAEPFDRAVDARLDAFRPDTVPPFAAIEARKRRRDRRRVAGTGVLSILAVAGAVVLVPSVTGGGTLVTPDGDARIYVVPTASSSPATTDPSPTRTGPLGDNGSTARCVEEYSIKNIGNRAFAFDGTVLSLGEGATNKAGKGQLGTVAVTFKVNEWFKGGARATVTVDLMAPTNNIAGDDTPAYEEGARLLVSGEPRWGGAPLDDAIAWSCGGFTRYYEPAVADDWRTGTA